MVERECEPSDERCGSHVDLSMSAPSPSSRELKFGVDRILSNDIRPGRPSNSIEPPCSECVSSLFRCCNQESYFKNSLFFATAGFLHVPKPIRPFSNVLTERDSDRGSSRSTNQGSSSKRKRSWSRAVFSSLQRKGLEKRFQIQKYITKPDRRQLAATLGLTDAQVKVWFQNRRMKWRHAKEMKSHLATESSSANTSSSSKDSSLRSDNKTSPMILPPSLRYLGSTSHGSFNL